MEWENHFHKWQRYICDYLDIKLNRSKKRFDAALNEYTKMDKESKLTMPVFGYKELERQRYF